VGGQKKQEKIMTAIYEPSGRAREYSPLAVNLFKGCSHGCCYCFAPSATRTERQRFSDPQYIRPRPGIIEALEKDAQRFAGDTRKILLCFTSDPYQPIEKDLSLTRRALEILTRHGLTVTVLTKGGTWGLLRDLDLLTRNPANAWSVTLTHDDPAVSQEWEPGASLPEDRIESLSVAHGAGLQTWVSFEPVFDPEAVYRLIKQTHDFVDLFKVGKLNYHPRAKEIDWPAFREKVVKLLRGMGKPYYIKDDLRRA
jgi:DNA repair photolyase